MLKKILLILIILVVGILAVIALQSDEFIVSRTASMKAPATKVFSQVNDFHNWPEWSPWAKLDPDMKITYSGSESGEGAISAWSGNDEVGEGKQTIIESRSDSLIKMDLEFIRPFPSTSVAEFEFKEDQGRTAVTWKMIGKKNFLMKAMGLVMDCDSMLGGQFEKGLANLKGVVEE